MLRQCSFEKIMLLCSNYAKDYASRFHQGLLLGRFYKLPAQHTVVGDEVSGSSLGVDPIANFRAVHDLNMKMSLVVCYLSNN